MSKSTMNKIFLFNGMFSLNLEQKIAIVVLLINSVMKIKGVFKIKVVVVLAVLIRTNNYVFYKCALWTLYLFQVIIFPIQKIILDLK